MKGPTAKVYCLLGGVLLLWGACAEPQATPDSEAVMAPALSPPPAQTKALSENELLSLAKAEDAEAVIQLLEPRPLAFKLDPAGLERLEERGLDPDVLDYLRKRSKLDWESLRGDVDPEGPE